MATFIWDEKVQWPPPAHILLNYDVVASGGVLLSRARDGSRRDNPEEKTVTQPYLALITPLTGGNYPDQGLPGGGGNYPDQGLPGVPPGFWGGRPPHHPDQGLPGDGPIHLPGAPDQGLPSRGGQPIPPGEIEGPAVPGEYAGNVVVGVKKPDVEEWTYTAFTVPSQPAPGPHRR